VVNVTAQSLRALLAEALAGLARPERDVLLLIAWEQLSYDEAGRALGIPVGTVRSRLHRARAKVRQLTAANIGGLAVGPGGMTFVNPPALPGTAGGWILSFQTTDPAGRAFDVNTVKACLGNNFQACLDTLGRLHLRDVIAYQPASRFWVLQWYETGIFLAAALVLAGFCYWWTGRRRLSI
jgi:predicted DNA-binding protein (UPF0251 family)